MHLSLYIQERRETLRTHILMHLSLQPGEEGDPQDIHSNAFITVHAGEGETLRTQFNARITVHPGEGRSSGCTV